MSIMVCTRYRTLSLRLQLLVLKKLESHFCPILIILTTQRQFFYTDIIQSLCDFPRPFPILTQSFRDLVNFF